MVNLLFISAYHLIPRTLIKCYEMSLSLLPFTMESDAHESERESTQRMNVLPVSFLTLKNLRLHSCYIFLFLVLKYQISHNACSCTKFSGSRVRSNVAHVHLACC